MPRSEAAKNRLKVDVRIVGRTLIGAGLLLALAHFALARSDVIASTLFNLEREAGFGTAFSAIQATFGSLLAFLVAMGERQRGRSWLWWGFLGLGLVLYAVDEVAQLHEALSSRLSGEIRDEGTNIRGGTPIIGVLLLPFFLIAMWAMLRVAQRPAARLLVAGLALFWLAGFGIEELEYRHSVGTFPPTAGMAAEDGKFVLGGIQETLEMLGVALITVGVLRQMALDGRILEIEVA